MNQFRAYLRCTNDEREIENIPLQELDRLFGNFLLGARKARDNAEYEPSTLRGFMSSLDRYLKKKGAQFQVIKNPMFPHSNAALTAKQKELKSKGLGNKPNAAEELTDADIDSLFQEDIIGIGSPQAVLNVLHINFSLVLGMRGGREQKDLSWGDIELQTDGEGDEYLVHKREKSTKTRTGVDLADVRKFKPKIWNLKENIERCPIAAYKLYASKRPTSMNNPDSPFFLAINVKNPKSGQAWYKNMPLGINSIYNLTKNMRLQCSAINSDRRITNHSVRKHLMQKCVDFNLPPTETVQISGHKNLQSVNNYSHMNMNKQKQVARALTNSIQGQSNALEKYTAAGSSLQADHHHVMKFPSDQIAQTSSAIHTETHEEYRPRAVLQNAKLMNCSITINNNYHNSPQDIPVKRRRIIIDSDSD